MASNSRYAAPQVTVKDQIIIHLFKRTRLIERYGLRAACHPADLGPDRERVVRLRWTPAGPRRGSRPEYTRSQAAAVSRTLRKLIERGTIAGDNRISGTPRRLSHVWLTEAGLWAGELLASVYCPPNWLAAEGQKRGFEKC